MTAQDHRNTHSKHVSRSVNETYLCACDTRHALAGEHSTNRAHERFSTASKILTTTLHHVQTPNAHASPHKTRHVPRKISLAQLCAEPKYSQRCDSEAHKGFAGAYTPVKLDCARVRTLGAHTTRARPQKTATSRSLRCTRGRATPSERNSSPIKHHNDNLANKVVISDTRRTRKQSYYCIDASISE